jgi:transcriptional regulator with XRE-family HTH domain
MSHTGAIIRTCRERSGLKQGELAQLVNMSQSIISGYECGRYEPRFEIFERIVHACGYQIIIRAKDGGKKK